MTKFDNLTDRFEAKDADDLVRRIIDETKNDLEDRQGWDDKTEVWTKLWACQPPDGDPAFEGGSNVVVPLVASACEQFHGRAFSSCFDQPSPEQVRCTPVSPGDVKRALARERVLNWQLVVQIPEYESEQDRMMGFLPKDGVAWKKWWWNDDDRPECMYVPGSEVIVPYGTRPFKADEGRITHRYQVAASVIEDRIRDGVYTLVDADLEQEVEDADVVGGKNESVLGSSGITASDPSLMSPAKAASDSIEGFEPVSSGTVMHWLYERHEDVILPGDNEPTPVRVLVDATDERMLGVWSRVIKGVTINQFVDYHFIYSPYGFYSYGFGHFLGPLNEIANTVFNQYIDAGKISNQPFLFYTPGAGLRGKTIDLVPGKGVQVRDINQVKIEKMAGLDGTLAQLLTFIDRYGSDISDNTDEARGRVQKGVREPTVRGQNARLEQTLLGFGVKIRRLIGSMRREFELLDILDSVFLDPNIEHHVVGDSDQPIFNKVDRKTLDAEVHIVPTASPAFTSRAQMRQEALELIDALVKIPTAMAPRADGSVRMTALADELVRRLLKTYSFGELANYVPEQNVPPMDPGVENEEWIDGEVGDVNDLDDHAKHIVSHRTFLMVRGKDLDAETHAKANHHIAVHFIKERAHLNAPPEPVPFDQSVQTIGQPPGAPPPAGGQGAPAQPPAPAAPQTDFAGQPPMGAA